MIEPNDLTGVQEALARRIILVARSIAPCIHSLDGEDKSSAIAILVGVAGEAAGRGSRLVKSQRIGSASVDYREVESWFLPDDRTGLRLLCGIKSEGGPVGSFPSRRPFGKIWPEE